MLNWFFERSQHNNLPERTAEKSWWYCKGYLQPFSRNVSAGTLGRDRIYSHP
ncbi:MAG TPA: hypothetical protein V6D33_19680 [Cyanophyceae cyanobacterium]